MGQYVTEDIRNFALIGHSSAGKTSLAEAMLHSAGASNRLGSVDDGTSIFDVDEEEKQRKYSIDPGFGHFSWKNKTINLIDTPGFPDFSGGALPCLAGVETAVLVISASAGIEVNTRKCSQPQAIGSWHGSSWSTRLMPTIRIFPRCFRL